VLVDVEIRFSHLWPPDWWDGEAWCPPSADGLRLGHLIRPKTHVFGGTEWERAKPDPRA
jgi:hypothetical protein